MRLSKREQSILKVFEEKEGLKLYELEDITEIPRRTLQRHISNLIKKGFLRKEGATKDYRLYKIKAPNSWIVFDKGELVGELSYSDGIYRFIYDEYYKGNAFDGLERDTIHSSTELFAFFENLIPEYERREKLLFDKELLAQVLPQLYNSHGSLDFVRKDRLFGYQAHNHEQRPSWLSVKREILGENEFPNILDDTSNTEHSNLSGYQTKIDVNVDWESKRVFEAKSAEYLLKPRNWKMDDFYRLGEILELNQRSIKKALLGVAKVYISKMPEYIKRVEKLEEEYDLRIQKSRKGKILFSKRLENIYNEKLISLRKLGILGELGLL